MNVDPRWATQRLQEHDQKRRALGYERPTPALHTPWDRDESAPPPSLVLSDDPAHSASSSPDARQAGGAYSAAPSRWASRFRDGEPPPPAPPPPITDDDISKVMRMLGIDPTNPRALNLLDDQIQQGALGPDSRGDLHGYIRSMQRATEKRKLRKAQLVPQHLLDRASAPGLPSEEAWQEGGPVQYDPQGDAAERVSRLDPPPYPDPRYGSVPGGAPPPPAVRTAQVSPLTQSQKRRLRRKRQRVLPQDESFSTPPTESLTWTNTFISAEDISAAVPIPAVEPVEPTDPNHRAYRSPTHDSCAAEVLVSFQTHGTASPIRFVCPLKPYPHPNQPHLVQIPIEHTGGAEVFLGWYNEGE